MLSKYWHRLASMKWSFRPGHRLPSSVAFRRRRIVTLMQPRAAGGQVVIEGQGSAHPKLGVKIRNSVEQNQAVLTEMICTGQLSLDHAIAKTKPGGTLRSIFIVGEDVTMTAHVEALYEFVVGWKRHLVPQYDPSAPVAQAAPKAFASLPPLLEEAKSGRSTCKTCGEFIHAGQIRAGLPSFSRGAGQVTAWSHATCFSPALEFQYAENARSSCKASGKKIAHGELRICARVFCKLPVDQVPCRAFH